MIRALAIGLLALLLTVPSALADVGGRASVIDGDTIEIHGQRIRLHGIDAPESSQTCRAGGREWRCGQQAALALADKIGQRTVFCIERDRDQYRRIVADCLVGGENLNGWLVAEGWALAYRQFSNVYVPQEGEAKAAGRGVWRGEFVAPWDWRRGKRLTAADRPTEDRSSDNCRIKGNISTSGERIYHVPGGRYHEATKISPSRGERWFCTEAEARSAGWRRSKR